MDKNWKVWGSTRVVELGVICKEMVWVAWLTMTVLRDCVYKVNKRGPRNEPSGTPHFKADGVDVWPTKTDWVRKLRQEVNQSRTVPEQPKVWLLQRVTIVTEAWRVTTETGVQSVTIVTEAWRVTIVTEAWRVTTETGVQSVTIVTEAWRVTIVTEACSVTIVTEAWCVTIVTEAWHVTIVTEAWCVTIVTEACSVTLWRRHAVWGMQCDHCEGGMQCEAWYVTIVTEACSVRHDMWPLWWRHAVWPLWWIHAVWPLKKECKVWSVT